jgi:thymidylate kinase
MDGYALVKYTHNHLSELPEASDIDMVASPKAMEMIVSFAESYGHTSNVVVKKTTFMTVISMYFEDGSFLSIDLIKRFKRRSVNYMSAGSVLLDAKRNNAGVLVASCKSDLEYCVLFYGLNGAVIPAKYLLFLESRGGEYEWETLRKTLGLVELSFEDLFSEKLPNAKRRLRRKVISRNPFKRLFSILEYGVDLLTTALNNRGFVMTLSGVDGAGKSTVLNIIISELKTRYRKDIVLLHHRPGLLPILSAVKHGSAKKAEKIAGETIPRKGQNKNTISSFIRFGYYFLDYLLGQFYVYLKYVIRGKIVIYDRYYFDFIVDPKRSNIQLNPKIMKALYKLIGEPKLNIVLWNDAEVVYRRKQELEVETISKLTEEYKTLFADLDNSSKKTRYVAVKNVILGDTVRKIMEQFVKVA